MKRGAFAGSRMRALAKIEDDIERLRFNVCIATIYEFANELGAALGAIEEATVADDLRLAFAEAGDMLVQCFAPMMPHLAEECWEALGHKTFVAESPWPVVDRSLIVIAPRDLCRAGQRQEAGRADDRARRRPETDRARGARARRRRPGDGQ